MKPLPKKTLLLITLIISLCSAAYAKNFPKTAAIIPPDTIVLLNTEDFQQVKTQFEKTNLHKLYKDPAMAPFIENLKAKWNKKIQELDENDIFRTFIDADVMPHGKLALAFVAQPKTNDPNQEPQIILISQWGPNLDKIKDAVSKLVQKNLDMGGHQKNSENYRGVQIHTMIDEASAVFTYSFIDDLFIGTLDPQLLKFVIAHIKGAESPTLENDPDYTDALAATGPNHDVTLFVNIKQIIKAAIARDNTENTKIVMTNLGLENVAALSSSLSLAREPDNQFHAKALLKINGTKKGICKILEADSAPSNVPQFIPPSAYLVTLMNLDIKKIYQEIYNILYSFNPMNTAMMQIPLLPPGPNGEPGVDLKTNIIDNFGSQIIFSQTLEKPLNKDSVPESIFALALENRLELEKSLSLIYDNMAPDARRELLGHTIYMIKLPPIPFLTGNITPVQATPQPTRQIFPKFAFTITDTHIILSTEKAVERAIRTLNTPQTPSVASQKWFNTAKTAIPSLVGFASLQDNAVSNEIYWWMMKEKAKIDPNSPTPPTAPQIYMPTVPMSDLFDPKLLPDFELVRKYFAPSAFYGVTRPDGFFFELKYLNYQ
ncbi:MAG: DUF3352 domain-containing protein [Planctomycetota bacterium]|jgi:hypothetical protein